jgi:hypothetical protein
LTVDSGQLTVIGARRGREGERERGGEGKIYLFLLPSSFFLLPSSFFPLPSSFFLLPSSFFLLPSSFFLT